MSGRCRRLPPRATARLLGALLLAAGLAACGPREPGPNVLFIVVDDQAPGTLGYSGNPIVRTPNIDRLARDGTFFDRAYVPLPQCAPSRATLLTGRYPHAVDVMTNIEVRLDPQTPTFASLLAEAGYRTGMIGKWHLGEPEKPQAGFTDTWISLDLDVTGHRRYFDPVLWVGGERSEHEGYLAEVLTDYAVEFIRAAPADPRPFLLWLNYKTPHYPYVRPAEGPPTYMPSEMPLPESMQDDLSGKPLAQRESYSHEWFETSGGYRIRSDTARYYEMLSTLDVQIGRLRRELLERSLLEKTLIVYMSDNGVLLGQHQMVAKGPAFYEELVRVPLFFHWPGVVPAGERREELVSALDLMPTLARLAGVRPPREVDGHDIWPLVLGRGEPVRDAVFFEYRAKGSTRDFHPMLGVATARYKYVRYLKNDDEELYDLEEDPREMNNLARAGVEREELGLLRARVDRFHDTIDERFWQP